MIVYSCGRRWFGDKASAETYRKASGITVWSVVKVEVVNRTTLTQLLDSMCAIPDTIPLFLIPDTKERELVRLDRIAREVE